MRLFLFALALTSLTTHAADAPSYAWQWRGPTPYQQAGQCAGVYRFVSTPAHVATVRTYSTHTSSTGPHAGTSSSTTYVTSGRNHYASARGGFGLNEPAPAKCMREAGYTLDASIAEPWDNPDFVRDFPGVLKSPQQIADEEAAQRTTAEAKAAAKAQADADHAARDVVGQKAQADYCASLTAAQRDSSVGRRSCPQP